MKLSFLAIIGAYAGLACAGNALADPIDELATEIKADYAYVSAHPQSTDPEFAYAKHSLEMRIDMARLDEQVAADTAGARTYYKAYAEANSKRWHTVQWQPVAERQPDTVIVNRGASLSAGVDNTGYGYVAGSKSGNVTEIYHNAP